jgi:hypothetical protein
MMGEVINGRFREIEVPVSEVLQGAMQQPLASVVVVGWKEDGEMYASTSWREVSPIILLLELLKIALLKRFTSD